MVNRDLKSWSEFRSVVNEIRERYGWMPYAGGRTDKNTILLRSIERRLATENDA